MPARSRPDLPAVPTALQSTTSYSESRKSLAAPQSFQALAHSPAPILAAPKSALKEPAPRNNRLLECGDLSPLFIGPPNSGTPLFGGRRLVAAFHWPPQTSGTPPQPCYLQTLLPNSRPLLSKCNSRKSRCPDATYASARLSASRPPISLRKSSSTGL